MSPPEPATADVLPVPPTGPFKSLSPRHFETVSLWIMRRSHQEIADQMGVAKTTVSDYLQTSCLRLGIKSQAGLRDLWWLVYAADVRDKASQ